MGPYTIIAITFSIGPAIALVTTLVWNWWHKKHGLNPNHKVEDHEQQEERKEIQEQPKIDQPSGDDPS